MQPSGRHRDRLDGGVLGGVGAAAGEQERVRAGVLKAYRWQYIVSGVEDPRFMDILGSMITPAQADRIGKALAPIVG